jgi:hypothetical protein
MAHKVILPPKKNYIPQFLKQRDINSYKALIAEIYNLLDLHIARGRLDLLVSPTEIKFLLIVNVNIHQDRRGIFYLYCGSSINTHYAFITFYRKFSLRFHFNWMRKSGYC